MDSTPGVKMVSLAGEARDAIEAHARRDYPRECCGILLGRGGGVLRAIAAANVAEGERQRDRYVLEPLAIVHAEKEAREQGLDIIGFYHSHPDHPAVASVTDTELAWEAYVYVIVSVLQGEVETITAWRRETSNGRPFMQGIPISH